MGKVLEWNFGNSNLYKKILIPHSDIKISINKWPKLLDLLCAYNAVLKWYHLVLDLYLHVSKCIELHFDMLGWELPLYSCIEIVSKFISTTLLTFSIYLKCFYSIILMAQLDWIGIEMQLLSWNDIKIHLNNPLNPLDL